MSGETRISSAERRALDQVLHDAVTYSNRNMRNITAAFLDLPVPAENYPEYWGDASRVKHPRSLNTIRQLLHEGGYTSPVQVYGDLRLVFLNALQWVPKATEAMRDAKSMETAIEDVWLRYAPPLPTLQEMDIQSAYEDDTSALSDRKVKARLTEKQAADVRRYGKETDALVANILEQYRSGLQATWVPASDISDDLALPDASDSMPLPPLGQAELGLEPSSSTAASPFPADHQPHLVDASSGLSNLDLLASTSSPSGAEFTKPRANLTIKLKRPAPENTQVDPDLSASSDDLNQEGGKKSQKLDHLDVKGQRLGIGHWIHLKNSQNSCKPVVAQVMRIAQDGNGDTSLYVREYLRPEDTVHSVTKAFYPNEVLQGPADVRCAPDAFEGRCYVMHSAQASKGNPADPSWTPDTPTYICEAAYDAKSQAFSTIVNWWSTQPAEARKDPLVFGVKPHDRPFRLVKLKSPFLRGLTGSGRINAKAEDVALSLPHRNEKIKWAKSGDDSDGPQPSQHLNDQAARDQFNVLPESIASRFRSDPATGELLWFQSPPVQLPVQKPAMHSFDYLLWRAQKGLGLPA